MWPSVLPLLAGAVLRMIRGVKTNSSKQAGLGLFRATGIYVGAILGSGILVLPAIAAKEAGPASLLAWALLLVFCTPVAFSFAEMSRQQPDAGGIAHFVTRAYGRRASAVAGYLFYFAIPFGAPATAVIGGNYIAHALGGGRGTALVAAALLLAAAFAGNAVGIRMSSGIQLVLMVLLVGLLALAVALAAPFARAETSSRSRRTATGPWAGWPACCSSASPAGRRSRISPANSATRNGTSNGPPGSP